MSPVCSLNGYKGQNSVPLIQFNGDKQANFISTTKTYPYYKQYPNRTELFFPPKFLLIINLTNTFLSVRLHKSVRISCVVADSARLQSMQRVAPTLSLFQTSTELLIGSTIGRYTQYVHNQCHYIIANRIRLFYFTDNIHKDSSQITCIGIVRDISANKILSKESDKLVDLIFQ